MSEIIANKLYLGSYDDSIDVAFLQKHRINTIICVARELIVQKPIDGIRYYYYPIDETQTNLEVYFPLVIDTAMEQVEDKRTLIHCYAGINRSPVFAMACLLAKQYCHCITAEHAMSYVRQIRPEIDPNPDFIKQLEQWYEQYKSWS
jgi:dual specificity phosphatase 12